MQATIHNEFLTLTVDTHGAEAVSLKNAAGEELLWQADPAIWKRHAPILFPWTRKEGKLLTAPQMKAFKNSLNFAVNSSLMDAMNIDWDTATYDTPALQNIQTALDIYHANPALAGSVFNSSTLRDISALSSLSQVEDGISYHSEEGFDIRIGNLYQIRL